MTSLLKWGLIFFVVSLIAGTLGFGGIASGAEDVASFLLYLFLTIVVVLLFVGLTIFRSLRGP